MITMWHEMIEAERQRDYKRRVDDAVSGMHIRQRNDAVREMNEWLSEMAGYPLSALVYRPIDAYERYARKHLMGAAQ